MKVIKQGAESKIILFEKKCTVLKKRISKKYRLPEIDRKFIRLRTRSEARIIEKIRRLGINTPRVLRVNEEEGEIEMEFIDGVTLKEFLLKSNDVNTIKKIARKLGKIIARLHENNLIHGDVTTSNVILKDNKLYLIDFGLAKHSWKIEEKAEDLLVLYYALKSTHFDVFELFWKSFIFSYKRNYKEGVRVLERLEEIKKRGRYASR